jgi:Flp pilus assembly protein TadG
LRPRPAFQPRIIVSGAARRAVVKNPSREAGESSAQPQRKRKSPLAIVRSTPQAAQPWTPTMLIQRMFNDRRGSVVPMFALSIVPVFGLIGAAVDYGHASTARSALQAAADATALAMSKNAATVSAKNLTQNAQNYFGAIFNRRDVALTSVTATYTSAGGSQVVVSATGSVKTTVMNLIGVPQITISATSTSTWSMSRLRVALVLDNTGSMAQPSGNSKISALKTATHNLLTQFQSAAVNDGDIYVSIIPFTKDVHVPTGDQTAADWTPPAWVDFTTWDTLNGTCTKSSYTTQASCTQKGGKWTPANHKTWNGCVTDRDQNFDTLNTTPTTGNTLFPAEQYSVCPTGLVPLSYDWTTLNNTVDAMKAAGNTNQAIGLAWGWQSLTQGTPLNAPAEDPNYTYKKYIILLTDGLNTEDRWYTSQSSIDKRQRILCDNIKTAGVTIYAVQVNTDNEPTSTLLQYCAGSQAGVADSSKFFLLTSPNQIVATFQQIGTSMSQLRIAK